MINKVKLPTLMTGNTYEVSTLSCDTPVVDVGDPESVLRRTGATGRGPRQKEFLNRSKGHVAVRINYLLVSVPVAAFEHLLRECGFLPRETKTTEPVEPGVRYACQACQATYDPQLSSAEHTICFCSAECQRAYVTRHNRLPPVGAEIPLGVWATCNLTPSGSRGNNPIPSDLEKGGNPPDPGGQT